MERIKILQVLPTLSKAGTEAFVMNYFRALNKSRFTFIFLVFSDEYRNYEREILQLGGEVHYCNVSFTKAKKIIPSFVKLVRILRGVDFDIVHCNVSTYCGPVLFAAKLAKKCKCISHSHFSVYEHSIGGKARQLVYDRLFPSLMFRYSDLLLACSKESGYALYRNHKFLTMRNAIAPSYFISRDENALSELRKELGINGNQRVYGNISRFEKPKNMPFVVDIFNEIHKADDSAMLVLAGKKGEQYAETIKKVKQYGLAASVIILDQRNDVNHLLQILDCMIYPSQNEGFSYILVEAQAASTPTLLSDSISDDIDLKLNMLHFISLDEDAALWAKVARSQSRPEVDPSCIEERLRAEGLSIEAEVVNLQRVYMNLILRDGKSQHCT